MTRAAALYHLQLVDQKLEAHRRQLAEVTARLVETEALRQAREHVAQAEAALAAAQQRQRQIEGELGILVDKIKAAEDRLYGGRVGNPKELADLQKDAAALNRRRQALEDDDLNAMIAVDEAHAARDAARTGLAAAEQAWQVDQGRFRDEQARLETLLAAIAEERDMAANAVRPDDLALYQSLRPRKGGQAVGMLRDGTCSACGVAPSATRIAQARGEDVLVRCGNCERILYVDLGHFVADEEL